MISVSGTVGLAAAGGDGKTPNNFGDTMTSGVAGPIAGIVILLLGIATVLLILNMNKRLRRLPSQFDSESSGTHDSMDISKPGA